MTNLYEEYAAIDAEEKAIKLKKEQMRPFIIKRMVEEGIDKIETSLGKFSLTSNKTWTYPEEVVELGEEFKAAKAKAESTGDATYQEEPSFRFTSAKL